MVYNQMDPVLLSQIRRPVSSFGDPQVSHVYFETAYEERWLGFDEQSLYGSGRQKSCDRPPTSFALTLRGPSGGHCVGLISRCRMKK